MANTITHALTIKQPWASLIVYGGKDIENRDWHAPRWIIGQRIAIHASKKIDPFDRSDAEDLCYWAQIPWPITEDQIKGGVILGTVLLVECVTKSDSPWFVGEFGFVLKDPRPLPQPIPARGQLGFWKLETPLTPEIPHAQ